jgi:hypothetical protein
MNATLSIHSVPDLNLNEEEMYHGAFAFMNVNSKDREMHFARFQHAKRPMAI